MLLGAKFIFHCSLFIPHSSLLMLQNGMFHCFITEHHFARTLDFAREKPEIILA
jgi:hypothetical protein